MNKECNIVRDLIPVYAEKLASEDSGDFIKEHCSNCEECKKILESSLEPLESEADKQDEKMQRIWTDITKQEEKKKRKRITIISICSVLVLLIAFLSYSFVFRGNTFFANVDFNVAENYQDRMELYTMSHIPMHPGRDDVIAASNAVKEYFNQYFEGCILLELSYNEELTEEYDMDTVVFRSSYYNIFDGPVLRAGEVVTYWDWYVTYNSAYQKWIVESYGHG